MANATQFNYRLSDGTIILSDVNPSQAATVDVAPILSGKIASPAPQEVLQRERDLQARGTQATVFDPNKSVAERGTIDTSSGITTSQAGIKTDPAIFATPENIKNALATPQQIAEQMKNPNWNAGQPITPQSIEDGIKNLSAIPSSGIPLGQNVQTFTTPSGLKVDAPTTLAPGLAGKQGIITTDSSKGETPLGIATSTSTTSNADATAAGADTTAKGIQDYIKLLTPPENDASTGVKNLIASITTDLNALKGRGTAQLSEEAAQGVNAKKEILQNAQTELAQKLAEYKSIQAKYQQLNANVEGKAITMGSIVGSQAQVNKAMQSELNVKASEIALIQANVAGAQGNLKLAQDSADRAVDLKYEDTKDAIDVRLKQLDLLQGELTKEEKIRSDAITMYLNDQKTLMATQVANEKDKNATLLNQMQKYPDAGITLSDTIQSANQKIVSKSAIYRKEAVPTGGGGANSLLSVSEAQALGVPYGTTQNQATSLNKTPQKPATAAQETTALYANRIEQSNAIISQLDDTISKMNPVLYQTQQNLPQFLNVLKTGNFQSVDQAQRNFVNAVLRRESGAVISPQEFDNARQQYFTQPGDTATTIAQKKANRDLVQQGFVSGAGQAYTPLVSTGNVMKSPDGKSQVNISDLTPAQIEEAKKAGWK